MNGLRNRKKSMREAIAHSLQFWEEDTLEEYVELGMELEESTNWETSLIVSFLLDCHMATTKDLEGE